MLRTRASLSLLGSGASRARHPTSRRLAGHGADARTRHRQRACPRLAERGAIGRLAGVDAQSADDLFQVTRPACRVVAWCRPRCISTRLAPEESAAAGLAPLLRAERGVFHASGTRQPRSPACGRARWCRTRTSSRGWHHPHPPRPDRPPRHCQRRSIPRGWHQTTKPPQPWPCSMVSDADFFTRLAPPTPATA